MSSAGVADESVVQKAAHGDHAAFESLLTSRIDGLFRTACAILGNEADARDAVQDACVSAWLELPRLRDVERFDAWLGRVLVNACRMRLRHLGRVREIPMAPEHDRPSAPGDDPAQHEDAEAVSRAFGRLKPDDRAILVLHHLEHRPVRQIASAVGVPVGTLKWRLHAARAALARALEDGR
jgi:RNA polymerase sigma-70 factor, ECF subfamily